MTVRPPPTPRPDTLQVGRDEAYNVIERHPHVAAQAQTAWIA